MIECEVTIPIRRHLTSRCGRVARWLLCPRDATAQKRACHVHLAAAVLAMTSSGHDGVTVTSLSGGA